MKLICGLRIQNCHPELSEALTTGWQGSLEISAQSQNNKAYKSVRLILAHAIYEHSQGTGCKYLNG